MSGLMTALLVLLAGLLWTTVLVRIVRARQALAQQRSLKLFASRHEEKTVERRDYLLIVGQRMLLPGERDWITRKLVSLGAPVDVRLDEIAAQRTKFFALAIALAAFLGWAGAPWYILVVIVVVAFFYSDLTVYNDEHYRNLEIAVGLPSVVDLLVLAVEAGMNVLNAVSLVAEKEGGPIGEEFRRVIQDIELGHSRTLALASLRDRATEPSIRNFANALIQADSLGVSIGPVLREQSDLLRRVRREQAREMAQKIPVKILFPIMVCFVPSLFMIVLGPVVLSFIT